MSEMGHAFILILILFINLRFRTFSIILLLFDLYKSNNRDRLSSLKKKANYNLMVNQSSIFNIYDIYGFIGLKTISFSCHRKILIL